MRGLIPIAMLAAVFVGTTATGAPPEGFYSHQSNERPITWMGKAVWDGVVWQGPPGTLEILGTPSSETGHDPNLSIGADGRLYAGPTSTGLYAPGGLTIDPFEDGNPTSAHFLPPTNVAEQPSVLLRDPATIPGPASLPIVGLGALLTLGRRIRVR